MPLHRAVFSFCWTFFISDSQCISLFYRREKRWWSYLPKIFQHPNRVTDLLFLRTVICCLDYPNINSENVECCKSACVLSCWGGGCVCVCLVNYSNFEKVFIISEMCGIQKSALPPLSVVVCLFKLSPICLLSTQYEYGVVNQLFL